MLAEGFGSGSAGVIGRAVAIHAANSTVELRIGSTGAVIAGITQAVHCIAMP